MNAAPRAEALGDSAVLLHFGEAIDAAVNARVHAAARHIAALQLPGIVELVPAYASLAVQLDPACWSGGAPAPAQRCAAALLDALAAAPEARGSFSTTIEIPVCYGAGFGPDLDAAAARCGLAVPELAALHAAADYRVALLGFAPGFPYLLGLDPRLHLPRLATPRTRVPAGSVAIGGAQTGIYPRELPGGWNLIGRTPLRLFDAARTPPNRIAAGMRLRFRAITAEEFRALQAEEDKAAADSTA
ncbi:5-oxoprolinase subunit PxpB [Tahibacter harae]|uniref:5-oxoprolinase subunit PxpB n=1 Tax=Tahibacter harae TaxID=2963937 RepID=A0ABT1QRN0_9GAMM|nr:5-oxoprolinase subunit PxpB [Tahibacter harae]MCQ4164960.1 5-oxoprolinase subunit PxpB [Tahibacter harae]